MEMAVEGAIGMIVSLILVSYIEGLVMRRYVRRMVRRRTREE